MFTAIIRKHKGRILLLILLGLAVYGNSLFNGFVWDDEEQVVHNDMVHSLGNLSAFFSGSTFYSGGAGTLTGMYYKPLMSLTFASLYAVFGLQPFFFHLFQLLLHLANSIFVLVLFVYFFQSQLVALSLALVFLLHPINVEAVAYVSALQDPLFFFWGMLSLLGIISLRREKKTGEILLIGLFLLLSLLSKETGIVFIPLVLGYLFLTGQFKAVPAVALSACAALFFYVFMRFGIAQVFFIKSACTSPILRLSLFARLQQIPAIVSFYLKTLFFPKDLAIAQHWLIDTPTVRNFYLPLAMLVIFVVSIFLIGWLLKRQKEGESFPIFVFFELWFFLGLGLHLQLIPLDMTVAERWFYLPLVGMLGMIGTVLTYSIRSQKWLIAVAVGLILALSVRTMVRTFDWRSGLTLFSHDIRISRGAFDLENNLGVELFRVGKIEEAADHFKRSTELSPCWWTNWNNLGVVWERRGDLGKAEEHYRQAIANSDYYLAYENYALILLKQQKMAAAKDFLEKEGLVKFPFNSRLRALYSYILKQEKL